MREMVIAGFVCLAFLGLCGSCTVYNLRTNVIYADLLKNSKNPLAIRCAWNGDQQVCSTAPLIKN